MSHRPYVVIGRRAGAACAFRVHASSPVVAASVVLRERPGFEVGCMTLGEVESVFIEDGGRMDAVPVVEFPGQWDERSGGVTAYA